MWKQQNKYDFRISINPVAWVIFLVACTACGYPALAPLCGDIICGPGQACAANQPICIDMGGCGNGLVDNGEICDDGNVVDGEMINDIFVADQCNHDCTSTQECGNGIQDASEACDHGDRNGMPADICGTNCHFISNICGNGITDPDNGEQCDNSGGADTATCNGQNAGAVSCHAPACGDGYANAVAGEACDGGSADTNTCNGSTANPSGVRCQLARCGDNYVNLAAGEACDQTTGADTSTCNGSAAGFISCQPTRCGDGYRNTIAGEACDNGAANTATCNGNSAGTASCKPAVCGDGYVNTAAGEQCEKDGDCNPGTTCSLCTCI